MHPVLGPDRLVEHARARAVDGTVALEPTTVGPAVEHPGVVRSTRQAGAARSEFAGFRFPPQVNELATEAAPLDRVPAAFAALALAV